MHVFTYGTLMFPEVWNAVVGRSYASVEGTLHGFAIYTVRDAVFPGIIAADKGDRVRGVVYLDVEIVSLARLDLFEDDFYRRETLSIDCSDGHERTADAYVVPAEKRAILSEHPWSRDEFVTSGGLEHFIRRFRGFSRLSTSPDVA